MSDPVAVDHRDDGVCVVTLQRPDRANALSSAVVAGLSEAFDAVRPSGSAVVLRGAGPNFCGGFDVKAGAPTVRRLVEIAALLEQLRALPCPTIAVAHGNVVGAGADLVAHCDVRISTPDARFSFPGLRKFGVVLGTERLASLIGTASATEVVACGKVLGAVEAERLGLVSHLVADEPAAFRFVESMAKPLSELSPRTRATLVDAVRADGRGSSATIAALSLSVVENRMVD